MKGKAESRRPNEKIVNILTKIFFVISEERVKSIFFSENRMATPTINKKKGNTRSVGVHPCHSA